MNPNQALWEKGDFTRIAESMRGSGEALVNSLGVRRGMKVLDLGCGELSIGDTIGKATPEEVRRLLERRRARIAAGEKPEQVRSWLIQRYGDWVSYRPPLQPITWPLWAAPIALLLLGGWLLSTRLVGRKR